MYGGAESRASFISSILKIPGTSDRSFESYIHDGIMVVSGVRLGVGGGGLLRFIGASEQVLGHC